MKAGLSFNKRGMTKIENFSKTKHRATIIARATKSCTDNLGEFFLIFAPFLSGAVKMTADAMVYRTNVSLYGNIPSIHT